MYKADQTEEKHRNKPSTRGSDVR